MISKLLSIAALVNATSASGCPDVPVQADFDPVSYTGRWFTISRNKNSPFEWWGQCETADYTLKDDGDIKVVNRGWFWWGAGYATAVGNANCPNGEAKCHVDFTGKESRRTGAVNYEVLFTDYKDYSVVYACQEDFGLVTIEDVWILARQNSLSSDMIQELEAKTNAILPNYDFASKNNIEKQDNCEYTSEDEMVPISYDTIMDMASKFLTG